METLTVAIISAIVALLSAGLSIFGQIRIKNIEANLEHKKHMRDKAEKAEIIISKYRDPLLNAAFDLQSRLFNILEKNLLFLYVVAGTEREKLYVVENTLYLFAQYFGWTEIIRREIQFLDLGDDRKTRELSGIQGSIRSLFVSDEFGPEFMVFYGEQRAIGEQMIVGDREDLTCLGYAAFTQIDDRFQKWFSPLKNDLDQLSVDRKSVV